MHQAVLTVRVDQKLKTKARRAAKQLGVPLSAIIKASLRRLVEELPKEYCHVCDEGRPLIPSKRLIRALKHAEKERKEGWVSPAFDNADDAIDWLNNPKRKYVRQLQPELYKK